MEHLKQAHIAVLLAVQAELRVGGIQLRRDAQRGGQVHFLHLPLGKRQPLQDAFLQPQLPDLAGRQRTVQQTLLVIGLTLVDVVDVVLHHLGHHRGDFLVGIPHGRDVHFNAEPLPLLGGDAGSADVAGQFAWLGIGVHLGNPLGDADRTARIKFRIRYADVADVGNGNGAGRRG